MSSVWCCQLHSLQHTRSCTRSQNLRISCKPFLHRPWSNCAHCPCQVRSSRPFKQSVTYPSKHMTCQAQAADTLADASSSNLLIVGPGVLGSYVGILWQQQQPSAVVVGQTNSSTNHDRLKKMDIQPRTKDSADKKQFPYVLFSAPPSGSQDYPAELAQAVALWDRSGAFVFTSSAGLYDVEDGSHCNEDCKIADKGKSERTDRLRAAEEVVLKAGGTVVRLVGLYHAGRGAHTFFLKQGEVGRWGGYTVNLIHYEDAASLCVAALQSGQKSKGRVYVGTDAAPLTFQDMIEACQASSKFSGHVKFTGQEGSNKGKMMSNCQTREALDWEPKYSSFEDFMAAGADDFYNTSPLYSAQPLGLPHSS